MFQNLAAGALAVLAIWFCGGAAGAVPETNLVPNPGFEQPAKPDGTPAGGWWLYQGQGDTKATVDQSVLHTGKASAKLQAATKAKSVLASAPFPVAPGDELRFEVWVRGEDLPPGQKQAHAGLAFRDASGKVFNRAYFPTDSVSGAWSLISGTAEAPDGVTSAEVHLGYTNTPGALWFDDVLVTITTPISFLLATDVRPWPGPQDITLLATSRQTTQFQGSIHVVVGTQKQTLPLTLASGASRQLKVPITLTGAGAHNYDISLLDSAGKPMRVLKGKFHTSPPLVLYPACPCYHAVGEGNGDTRIDARVNLNPAQRSGLRLAVTAREHNGKWIQMATTNASQGDIVGLNLQLPIEAPATVEITATLLDRTGKEIAQAATDVHVSPREESIVTMGPDGFLRVAGKPNFPIGLYSSGRYEDMGKAGFTATHSYGITAGPADDLINANESQVKQLLDRSWTNGMRMMVELPRKAIVKSQWSQVRRRILTFHNHPGLLCWGSEERVARGETSLATIAALYHLVHELDANHPLVLGDTKDVIQKLQVDRRDFFPDACMDAGIWWWYPIPLKGPDGNGLDGPNKPTGRLEPPSWLTTTLSRKPLWIAIQSYQHPRLDARFPTPAEYRCMAYLSIINGVKALWFYTGSGQKDYYGKPAGLLNKPEEAHWDYVQKLVAELREFSPIIMAPAPAAKLSLSPADAPVEFALRELNGKLYLITANISDRPQSVRFSGAPLAGRQAKVRCETHSAVMNGDTLAADFAPFAVHLYELDKR
jgi:hypothetical protein